MKHLSLLILVVGMASFALTPARAAPESQKTEGVSLRPAGKIGVGWKAGAYGWMSYVSFGPHGRMVAGDESTSLSDSKTDLTIWSFPRGKFIRRISDATKLSDGWKHYVGKDGVRSLTTDKLIVQLPSFAITAFGPRDGYLATASDKNPVGSRIRVFDLRTGKQISAFSIHAAESLAASPDGRIIASGNWDTVTLWNPRTGTRIGVLHGTGRYVESLSFSGNGKLLAAGTDTGALFIWDLRHRKLLHSVEIGGGFVSDPAFSPDGKLVAVGIYGTGAAWVVNVGNGRVVAHEKVSDIGCGSVAFSPDGRYLITPSTGGLVTWPWDEGGTIRVFKVIRRGAKGMHP